jgi:hypothetical protein
VMTRSVRAFAVKPRAFGAPQAASDLTARPGRAKRATMPPIHTCHVRQ